MRVLLLCKIFFIKYLKIKYFLLTLQQTRAIIKYYNRSYKTKVEWEGKMQERFKIFTVLIANINREIRRVKTEIMANHNLKCPHVSTIYYLYVHEQLTLKELCEACNEDKGAISRSVKSLEKEGLVINPLTGGIYKNKLRLTEKGKVVGKDIVQKIDNAIDFATQGLSEQDKNNIYRDLAKIVSNLAKFNIEK